MPRSGDGAPGWVCEEKGGKAWVEQGRQVGAWKNWVN